MFRKLLPFAAAVLFFTSCSSFVKSPAEIGDFSIKFSDTDKPGQKLCLISGVSKDSALWIKSYLVRYKKDAMYLFIERSSRSTGHSSPYYLQFVVPENVKEIHLGKDSIIWSRQGK